MSKKQESSKVTPGIETRPKGDSPSDLRPCRYLVRLTGFGEAVVVADSEDAAWESFKRHFQIIDTRATLSVVGVDESYQSKVLIDDRRGTTPANQDANAPANPGDNGSAEADL
jgi:hypothetical protein